jgi:hypothetical protein
MASMLVYLAAINLALTTVSLVLRNLILLNRITSYKRRRRDTTPEERDARRHRPRRSR